MDGLGQAVNSQDELDQESIKNWTTYPMKSIKGPYEWEGGSHKTQGCASMLDKQSRDIN